MTLVVSIYAESGDNQDEVHAKGGNARPADHGERVSESAKKKEEILRGASRDAEFKLSERTTVKRRRKRERGD